MSKAVEEPGVVIGGYTVLGTLGKGGSGNVYHVENAGGIDGALKLIDDPSDDAAVARLRREVESLKTLHHHAVPAVLDAEFDGDQKFVVYQFVEGQTLTAYIAEYGPLRDSELAEFAATLEDALEAVHREGVVHRDVTPANVMMNSRGPMLIDFGLSQLMGDDRLTRTGLVSGTVGYVAPEVIDGGEPDKTADLWSWAAVVAFAAMGASPFGHGKGALRRTLEGKAELPSIQGADELAAALSPNLGSRPAPNVVVAALRGMGDGLGTEEMYAPSPERRKARKVVPTTVMETEDSGIEWDDTDELPEIAESRSSVIGTWAVALALAAAIAPLVAFFSMAGLAVMGRAEHRRVAGLSAARAKRGERRRDTALVNASVPWFLLRSTAEVLPAGILAVVVGGAWAGFWWWLVSSERLVIVEGEAGVLWGEAVALATAGAGAMALLWWGPLSGATRDGVRRGALLISGSETARRGWIALAVILIGALGVAIGLQAEPWTWPLPPLPDSH